MNLRKNYFFSVFGLLFCFQLSAQQLPKTYQDSAKALGKAANEAFDSYDFNSSLDYSMQLIELASAKGDFYNLHRGYNGVGTTYEVLDDTIRARENYLKALEFAQKSGNDTILWYAYNNLGNVLSIDKNTVEEGLANYKKAIEIVSRIDAPEEALTPIINIAWTHLENGQSDRALPYLRKAWKLNKQQEDRASESNLLTLFGMYHSGRGEFEDAREHFEIALEVAERHNLLVQASFAYEEFAKMLFKSGNFEEAYVALEKSQTNREKIFQKEKNLQREATYERFQTERYKRDLAAAQREQVFQDEVITKTRQLTVIMVIFLIVMFVFLILLFRSNRIRKNLISEQKEKNKELIAAKEKAERLSLLKTRFFSTVSHELRTPLYGVVGLTSLLLEDNKNEAQREDLKSLKFSADYLLALINDVLQMNKMESNLVHLENSNFNIKELFQGIVKSFETTGNLNHNKIELNIDESIPQTLVGDAMRLSQIMMNLVGNAVKFTEHGLVWVKAERRTCSSNECLIYFEVGDTGAGIPKSKQEDIFEEFSQLKSKNQNYQGTGLGLPIVKKLLHLFGSRIYLESEEGKGAVFSFEISFEIGAEKATEVKEGNPESLQEDLVKNVLIVDDNRINQVVTRRILEKKDFVCQVAGSGEEAIEIIKKGKIDLVLMDVNMPGMSGMEATREVRKFNSSLPIIALTAVEVGEMREEILGAGMNDIINKPYDIPQFFNTIFRNLLQPVA